MGTTKLAVIDCTGIGELDVAECGDLRQSEVIVSVAGGNAGLRRSQRGMVSAEWAVGIIAAIGIAGVLIAVVTNGAVQDALLKFILELIHSFSGYMTQR